MCMCRYASFKALKPDIVFSGFSVANAFFFFFFFFSFSGFGLTFLLGSMFFRICSGFRAQVFFYIGFYGLGVFKAGV